MKNQTGAGTLDLQASRDKLARDITAMAGDAADLLKDLGGRNLQRAQDALSQAQAAIRDGGSELADTGADYVKAHPLTALGAALAAGVLLGVLLARR
jgi:ElaB/YqjD/DUF883 family membrane-anchored ribosome-binding protein